MNLSAIELLFLLACQGLFTAALTMTILFMMFAGGNKPHAGHITSAACVAAAAFVGVAAIVMGAG